ncbi:hypothetical protein DFAR_200009 [Desulfarculales bacterium]
MSVESHSLILLFQAQYVLHVVKARLLAHHP